MKPSVMPPSASRPPIDVSDVRLRFPPASGATGGVVAFIDFILEQKWQVARVALRFTRDGSVAFSYPRVRRADERRTWLFRPIDDSARIELEGALLASLHADMPRVVARACELGVFVAPDVVAEMEARCGSAEGNENGIAASTIDARTRTESKRPSREETPHEPTGSS